jgi:hypothetical protein
MSTLPAPTVVTAYYPIKSKFGAEKYAGWIRQFWPQIPCNLIFFTDTSLVGVTEGLLAGRKGNTKIIGLPFKELSAFTRLSPVLWLATSGKDPERAIHSPELYAVWYEKKEFVRRAIEMNPFGSEHFVWADAGICRYPEWIPHLAAFPRAELIPRGRMLQLQVSPFQDGDSSEKDFEGNRIGGGILASDRAGWAAWSKAYDLILMRMYLAGRFVGKDQNIMAGIALEHPELVVLVPPYKVLNPVREWFSLLFFLAGLRVA